MNIIKFQAKPVSDEFNGVPMTVNVDAFTPEFYRNAATRFRELKAASEEADNIAKAALEKAIADKDLIEQTALGLEAEARFMEAKRDIWAIMLAGTPDVPVLMEWALTRTEITKDPTTGKDLKEEEVPIPVTEAEIKKLKPALVEELYSWAQGVGRPKEQQIPTTVENETTPETTDVSLLTQETQQAENPTT